MRKDSTVTIVGAILEPAGAFYDRVWDELDRLDRRSPASFHRRRLVRRLALKYARDARRVLDAGCGPGNLLEELAQAWPAAALAGADVSPRSLELAARRCPQADLFQLDLSADDFDERHAGRCSTFDLVVCSEVLEHLGDDALGLSRLKHLAAPGAIVIVTVPGGEMSRFDRAIGHYRHYRLHELRRLLERAELEPLESMAWGFPFQNLYRSAVRIASRAALPGDPAGERGAVGRALGAGYSAFGQLMRPLFFFNLPWLGEQLVAVARRRRP